MFYWIINSTENENKTHKTQLYLCCMGKNPRAFSSYTYSQYNMLYEERESCYISDLLKKYVYIL